MQQCWSNKNEGCADDVPIADVHGVGECNAMGGWCNLFLLGISDEQVFDGVSVSPPRPMQRDLAS
jgi:hypothetical protein